MKPFRFGIQCLPREPFDRRAWAGFATRVEELGYSVLTVADHLEDPMGPFSALAAAAMVTSELRLGTMVACNDFRHPALTAKEAATIDQLSGGRFELGLGAGWMRGEYHRAGMVFDRPGDRIDRLSESLDVIEKLWVGERVRHEGRFYRLDGLRGNPTPVHGTHMPIMIGGGGRRILELAARRADIVGLNLDLRAPADTASLGASISFAATDEKLGWIRHAGGARPLELAVRVHECRVTPDVGAGLDDVGARLGMSPEVARHSPHVLCGTVEMIVEDLIERRERFGISYLTVGSTSLEAMAPVVARLAGT